MKSFGKIIKEEREKRGFYLRQVAAAIDVDQAIISKFEKGNRKPSRKQVLRFVEFYKLDKEQLIIAWLSDRVVYDLRDEDLATKALKVAERKIKYMTKEGIGK